MTPKTETQNQALEFIVKERAIIYCRVSTDEQAETGTSIDNQAEKCLAYAQAQNMQVIATFKEDYTGRVLDRPELNKVREALRRGQADNLIVYKPNRLDRSEWGLNTLLLMQELKSLNVNLHYAQDNRRIDLSNPMEVFMYGSFGGWQAGEDYSETVRKLYEGRLARAKAGYVVLGGTTPYGYRKYRDKEKKCHFEIVETEAEVIHSIFRWFVIDGLSLCEIANRLIDMGIKTKKGGRWRQTVIHKIVRSEVYCGVWYFSKRDKSNRPTAESIPVPVPAIISRELWEAAQERLKENKATAHNRTPGRYLMANRVTCGCCNYKMHGGTRYMKKAGKIYPYSYYVCPNASERRREGKCKLPFFRSDIVDAKVWQWLEEIANDEARLLDGLRGHNERQQAKLEPIRRELALVEATLKDKNQEWDEEIANLKFLPSDRAKAKKGAEIAEIEAIIKSLEAEKTKLSAQLVVSTFTPEQAIGIIAFMGDVAKDIESLRQAEAQGVDSPKLRLAVYEEKRRLLAWLDVQVKLYLLDGKKKAEVTAKVCPEGAVLSVDTLNTLNGVNERKVS